MIKLQNFDYAIIGAGAAGMQLALAMSKDQFFQDKQILLLDKSDKKTNDKTWCFWEKGNGKWDDILDFSWDKGWFYSTEGESVSFNLAPYQYKKLRSIDFYNFVKKQLAKNPNIYWETDEVLDVSEYQNKITIKTADKAYDCNHCFDSRLPKAFDQVGLTKYIFIKQHFKGWYIQHSKAVFDPSTFTMFDFRVQDGDSTSFIYILPTSEQEALIEFTYFTDQLVAEEVYDQHISKYISKYLGDGDFVIKETEQGVIPMTDFPFHQENDALVTKIGTAGSWVRGSTGYSFKISGNMVEKIIANIKKGLVPNHQIINKKSLWHDQIFLGVLKDQNHLMPDIFHSMYKKNSIQAIFRFLDGESSIAEDTRMIANLPKLPFLKSLLR